MLLTLILLQSLSPLDVEGVWSTGEGKAHVEITLSEDGRPHGEIVWYANYKSEPAFDENNPEPRERKKELLGQTLLEGFERGDEGRKWRRGKIYDPRSGNAYRSAIYRLNETTLAVEGCLGFICRTQEWPLVPEEEVIRIEREPMTLPIDSE